MKKRWIFFMIVLLCVGSICISCSQEKEVKKERGYTVGVVTKSSTSEYWMSLCEGVEKAAQEYGMDVIILQPDSETNKEAQIKMVETLAKKKVDIIAVSPLDSQASKEYLKIPDENGIPVITYDDGFDDEEIPYIGIDNEKAGYELMKYLAGQMDHKGEVGIISGNLSQKCHRLRIEGAKRYLKEEPDMTLAYVESGYSNLQMSKKEINRLRQENPNVTGAMVTSAATAMGFVDAVLGENMKIVSVDAQTDAVEALKNGKITALTAQSGYDMGYEMVRYIAEFREKGEKEKQKIIEAEMLTKDNIEQYLELQDDETFWQEE